MARPGGSRAVESFLRNFEGERQRYQEVLEVALCYGVFCLAQNFPLQGITFAELKAVTRYDEVRKRDYYVNKRGGTTSKKSPPPPPSLSRVSRDSDVRRLRTKPPHAWRDGAAKAVADEFASQLPANGLVDSESKSQAAGTAPVSVTELLEPQRTEDDVDFHSRLLGKSFVDTAWTVFTGRKGVQVVTGDALDELFVRVDQRKKPAKFQAVGLPVGAFSEFLNAYVVACVSQFQHKSASTVDDDAEDDLQVEIGDQTQSRRTNAAPIAPVSEATSQRRRGEAVDPAETARRRLASSNPVEREQARQIPKSLQHIKSKIQPELSARREKLLRVKKTQSQLMKESLARARLAEYEAKKHLEDARDRAMLRKKAPLDDIPQGVAALEIVGNFVRSPLMDTFGQDGGVASVKVTQAIGKKSDPVQEELYGAATLDDAFVGCQTPKQRQPIDRPKRDYNGWLGDFGPVHTKTVRHEWSDDEEDDDRRQASTFEWNFDNFAKEASDLRRRSSPSVNAHNRLNSVLDGSDHSDVENADSGNLSDGSNSVYRWLKEAV